MKFFDSHCHLNFPDFDPDRDQILRQCVSLGVESLCIPATRFSDWVPLLQTASTKVRNQPQLHIALGLHPCFENDHQPEYLEALERWLAEQKSQIAAIGETGLDFYDRQMTKKQRQSQLYFFTGQVKLACKHQLPLIIHARKSHDQILKILRQHHPVKGGIIHAFSGSGQQANQYIDLNFKLGFGGGITYPRARKTRQLAASLPLESIVLETDAPDMPLQGFQGQRNSPEHIPAVAQCLASLRPESLQQIAAVTTANCQTLFYGNL